MILKKITVVFTGGTIGSSRAGGVISPDAENGSLLLDLYKQKYGAAEFDTVAPYTILSENLCAENLLALRECVSKALQKGCGGVIVTHGTDTLQYSAAYLDFVFGACGVPVVLVSAAYPLEDERSNGLDNFAAAVALIRSGEKGVFVAYRNAGDSFTTIHRGRDVLPHLPLDDSVYSLFDSPCGYVKGGRFEKNPSYKPADSADLSGNKLCGEVLFVRPYVGMSYPEIPQNAKAVLLEGWHSGTLPTGLADFRSFCLKAKQSGVPVYLTGSQTGFEYASKQAFAELGIRVLPPMSPVAAYVMLWLL